MSFGRGDTTLRHSKGQKLVQNEVEGVQKHKIVNIEENIDFEVRKFHVYVI